MSSSKNLDYEKTAFLSKSNSTFIEEMYVKFVNNDPSLPDSWKNYFDEIGDEFNVIINEINGPSWSPSKKVTISRSQNQNIEKEKFEESEIIKSNANSIKAVAMIRSYRQRGHLIAKLDPLGLMETEYLFDDAYNHLGKIEGFLFNSIFGPGEESVKPNPLEQD